MCSDTLIVGGRPQKPLDLLLAKQYGLSRNLIVCYTSSNVDATIRALLRCAGTSNVKRLGSTLREVHDKYGEQPNCWPVYGRQAEIGSKFWS